MKYKYLLLIFLSVNSQKYLCNNKKAFVVVPVADLVGDYLDLKKNNKFQTYDTLPLESKKGTNYCKRINQALFNEIVEVVGIHGNQVQVKTLNTFYQNKNGGSQSTYWAKKNNFIYLEDLKKANLNKKLVPKPIKYKNKNIEKTNKNIVTLKFPFYDKTTNKTYSAGTRFVKTSKNLDNQIEAFIFNTQNYNFKKTKIPKELCANNTTKDNKAKRKEFLEILKNWANIKNGFIPYVWGGSSYTHACYNKDSIVNDQEFPVYTRPSFRHTPTPGLDCSGLVARAAQICNIPYFYKNTITAKNNLKKIKNIKKLQDGDLIIYKGHVIVVSDKKNNKIIEARTNEHGCGRVHEVYLSEIFDGIKTYQDLFDLRNRGNILERIDTNGEEKEKILDFDFYYLIS
jgi:cell wall-associated NlpC family hydrolase